MKVVRKVRGKPKQPQICQFTFKISQEPSTVYVSQSDREKNLDTLPAPPWSVICRYMLDDFRFRCLSNLRKVPSLQPYVMSGKNFFEGESLVQGRSGCILCRAKKHTSNRSRNQARKIGEQCRKYTAKSSKTCP